MEENKNEIKEVEIEETEIFGITDEELEESEEVKKESDDNVSSES
jgi:hypothetical protein